MRLPSTIVIITGFALFACDDEVIVPLTTEYHNSKPDRDENVDHESTLVCYLEPQASPKMSYKELVSFFKSNSRLPEGRLDIEGKVFVAFTVNTDGSISNVEVVKSLHPIYDQEAVRLVKLMPQWNPAMNQGRPMQVNMVIPLFFNLSGS